ncbi:uncharacterized protein LOC116649127 [Phoca vitulina]|uniref:uncharacterized protein LOC116649127 n=1 Tax=Phoca vitulina TaxID=9720 RepID=UPI001395F88B|nr:uncharacterized protein LOC116649127 [Phoca vitulina]
MTQMQLPDICGPPRPLEPAPPQAGAPFLQLSCLVAGFHLSPQSGLSCRNVPSSFCTEGHGACNAEAMEAAPCPAEARVLEVLGLPDTRLGPSQRSRRPPWCPAGFVTQTQDFDSRFEFHGYAVLPFSRPRIPSPAPSSRGQACRSGVCVWEGRGCGCSSSECDTCLHSQIALHRRKSGSPEKNGKIARSSGNGHLLSPHPNKTSLTGVLILIPGSSHPCPPCVCPSACVHSGARGHGAPPPRLRGMRLSFLADTPGPRPASHSEQAAETRGSSAELCPCVCAEDGVALRACHTVASWARLRLPGGTSGRWGPAGAGGMERPALAGGTPSLRSSWVPRPAAAETETGPLRQAGDALPGMPSAWVLTSASVSGTVWHLGN